MPEIGQTLRLVVTAFMQSPPSNRINAVTTNGRKRDENVAAGAAVSLRRFLTDLSPVL
jgi:hypothetical protein